MFAACSSNLSSTEAQTPGVPGLPAKDPCRCHKGKEMGQLSWQGTYHIWCRRLDCNGLGFWHSSRAALLSLINASSLWFSSGSTITAWQGHGHHSAPGHQGSLCPLVKGMVMWGWVAGDQEPGGDAAMESCLGAFGGSQGPPSEICTYEPLLQDLPGSESRPPSWNIAAWAPQTKTGNPAGHSGSRL